MGKDLFKQPPYRKTNLTRYSGEANAAFDIVARRTMKNYDPVRFRADYPTLHAAIIGAMVKFKFDE